MKRIMALTFVLTLILGVVRNEKVMAQEIVEDTSSSFTHSFFEEVKAKWNDFKTLLADVPNSHLNAGLEAWTNTLD